MSKAKKMQGSAARRGSTAGSAYDNTIQLGDDFFKELEGPQPNQELQAENQHLQAENAELKETLDELKAADVLNFSVAGQIRIGGFTMTPTGLHIDERANPDDWHLVGEALLRLEGAIQWLIGDWLAYGEDRQWGDATRLAEKLGRDEGTLHNWMWVARKVSYRYEDLSWTHHYRVAKLAPEQQRELLEEASQQGWSVSRLARAVKALKRDQSVTQTNTAFETMFKEAQNFAQRQRRHRDQLSPEQRRQLADFYRQLARELDA